VLYLEFIPVGAERFSGRVALPGPLGVFNRITDFLLSLAGKIIGKVMAVVLILGIVFSCLHQSSLGGLMLIAPYKEHPAWFTPVLPLLFLLSAFAVGLPMAIFISLVAGRGLDRPIELPVLSGLSRYAQVFLGLFLAIYVGNMVWRRTYVFLGDGTLQGGMFLAEALLFILPFVLLFFSKVRETEKGLFAASSLVILAIMVHRLNVMLISYTAPFTDGRYAPKLTEYLVLMGIFGLYVFLFRSAAVIFPIFPEKKKS
jgi:Ni/Fe-hydrogenase subunit HybB-like protein